jgi:hypothetical protein
MKKVALILLAVSCFTFGKAQLKPEAGSVGLGFRVTGLASVAFSNFQSTGLSGATLPDVDGMISAGGLDVSSMIPQEMLFGRYYLASDLALRVGLGINSMSAKGEGVDSVGTAIDTYDMKMSGFSFGLSVGVEKHFASAASRLDPYAGAQINFASIGSITYEENHSVNSDPAFSSADTYEIAGGSNFGIVLLGGFNYFFSDNFAIGAEMGWGFSSTSVGGDWTSSESATSAGTTTTTNRTGNAKTSTGGFGVGSTAGVNASIFW